jgi:hypothetical protein
MLVDGEENDGATVAYTELEGGEVDYGVAFRHDVEVMSSSLLLMGEVLLPGTVGSYSLPESWRPLLEGALALLDFGEEPLSTGDVCIHESCQAALHTMATFVEHCADRVSAVDNLSPDEPLQMRRGAEAFAMAMLTVFAFGAHFLDAEQCRDRNLPAMVGSLQQVIARGATGELQTDIPVQLQAALRQHTEHIWLHTMGTVHAALIVDEVADEQESDEGESDEQEP